MTIARIVRAGNRLTRRAPANPPATAQTLADAASRGATTRARTNGTTATPFTTTESASLSALASSTRVVHAERSERCQQQDAHRGPKKSAVDRDGEHRRDAERRVDPWPPVDGERRVREPGLAMKSAVAANSRTGMSVIKRSFDVRSNTIAPTTLPNALTTNNQSNVGRSTCSPERSAPADERPPSHMATVFVAFALMGGKPAARSAGKLISYRRLRRR